MSETVRRCWQSAARLSPLLLAVRTAACGDEIQSAVNPSGPPAYGLSHLWWIMFYVCSIVYVIVLISVVAAPLKDKAAWQVQNEPIVTPYENDERTMRHIVVSAAVIIICILFLLRRVC